LKIEITGSTGFVGKSIISYFSHKLIVKEINCRFPFYNEFDINSDCLIHLAGKAHDLKKISNPDDYYQINTEFTKAIFDKFLESSASIFITLSTVKAAADFLDSSLTENHFANPKTHYGKSKLLAEQYILSKLIPEGKRVYILRPCMIHGPSNKGNLNLLYKFVSNGWPWLLGAFENKRSFCSIDNLCFVINELIENDKIQSGIYNIADDDAISTNELINIISECQGKKSLIWNIPPLLIKYFSKIGDLLKLPLNSESLNKLTENYIVSNYKIKNAINKPFPINSKDGLIKTFNSFNNA
jgi:nucleoside-diphosphate-sugar epimerase